MSTPRPSRLVMPVVCGGRVLCDVERIFLPNGRKSGVAYGLNQFVFSDGQNDKKILIVCKRGRFCHLGLEI